jgi:2-C-methyl-D-erythritol 4-phosphate cytidylyltransferase
VVDALPTADLRQCQTPLAFSREILERAYQMARARKIETPTTYELVLMLGVPVVAVAGEESNVKVATRFEWEVANALDWKRVLGQMQ